jgi:predicted dienelactone hydrolase
MGNGLRRVGSGLLLVAVTLVGVVAMERSTIPAERIDFNYSLLGFKLQVQDLATFAETGEVSDSLNYYFCYIPDKQTQQLRKFLTQSYDVDPVLVYRYSRTSAGIKMLQRIGEIIQLPGYINGFYGLRAAVVQTAQSPEGINFVDFLQRFPTDIKLNLGELLQLVKQVDQAEEDTQKFIASLSKQEVVPKNTQKNNQQNIQFRDLSQPGNYRVRKQTLNFYDRRRDRNLVTDLYLPQKTDNIPMIVVSNGLGAKRDRFEELAGYLVSRGFGVVIPDHPGSDRDRQKAFVQGLYRENFDATEFIDRPLDISYILDRLEQLNRDRLDNRLNLQQVGFFGYSIGATTGLSLAGAEFDFTQLEQDCSESLNLLNISILYQCRALELPRDRPSLQDDRIKAAYMFVPFGQSIFGSQKQDRVSIPIMFQVVDQDFLTSLLDEQVPLFNSLDEERYLIISEKLPHSNVTLSKEVQSSQAKTTQVAKTYQNLLSLVFFQSYVAKDSSYLPYLSTAYLKAIAKSPYNLHLLAN